MISLETQPPRKPAKAPVTAPATGMAPGTLELPRGMVLAERAAGWLRDHLDRRGLGHYRIFTSDDLDLGDIDQYLPDLGGGQWDPAPSLVPGGVQPDYIYESGDALSADTPAPAHPVWPPGVLRLAGYEAVVARWHWYDVRNDCWYTVWFLAAPSAEQHARLRGTLRELRRRRAAQGWRVVSGSAWRDERIPPDAGGLDDLVLSEEIRRRLATEVVGFFSPGAATLYGKVGVPYRRGVLMYGPPGNGKTSIIRSLSGMLPDVAGLVLRSGRGIDEDDFTAVVKRWVESAPAILVIEDLNWMIPERVSVSAFLNQLDGLATPRGAAGLLMIASTNHPETLDPAINDRPGRFDVMLEVPSPDGALRREFFRRATEALGDVPDEPVLAKLVTATSGLSFAHLREVVQAAGLAAVRDGRDRRSEADLLDAAAAGGRAHQAADRGFPARPDEAFGLAQFRGHRGD